MNLDFFNQVRNLFEQMKNASRDHSLAYGQQTILTSLRSANNILAQNKVNPLQNERLEENIERIESLRSSIQYPRNSHMRAHLPAMPNSKSMYEIKEFDNVTDFLHRNVDVTTSLQASSSREPNSIVDSVTSAYKSLNSLHGTEKESSDQSMPEYPQHIYSTTNSPNSGLDALTYSGAGFSTVSGNANNFLQIESENLLCNPVSFSNNPCLSRFQENGLVPHHILAHEQSLMPDPGECPSLFSPQASFMVQNDLMQLKNATQIKCQGSSAFPELPSTTPEETIVGTSDDDIKECDANTGLLESMILDFSSNNFVQDWGDDSVLQAGNLPNLGDTNSESVKELANQHLSTGGRDFPARSVIEQLLGGGVHKPAGHIEANALAGRVSKQSPQFGFGDRLTAYTAHVPSLASGSCASVNAQNGSSKATSVPPADIPVDDICSLNTGNSQGSQSNNTEGMKVAKKRSKAGESTRPRPKDRQLIQDRVKELREMVPNGAKCSIDALLERTIKHMLFLQSVTKYAEKIKQADEPKMIDKESGVILKDNPKAGKNGGATWAYEVAGQTMVCPIIIEELSPPGQMLVEMLCEERGFFLEIADNIRGFGLTILKGLMEARDGKIWARFLVEANRGVTRMDIFLSLVQLLEQNCLAGSTDQVTKVMNNGGSILCRSSAVSATGFGRHC
ncbi:hypothetical protein EJB05_53678 [Eragrostis curvula]|uniref:BHLH domain-containing protein n=1 Tax=Eragrostis curvula TaxID=38414 RepID=A0A5J9SPG0_9POAL|nr:hypothetical protein EJB05_53678 [Eragrostis curvula]